MNAMDALRYGTYAAVPAAVYGANALASGGDERWDRTAANTVGNLAGGYTGMALGGIAGARLGGVRGINPGAVVGTIGGALGGGYISDRVADMVDPSQGRISATELLNAHLENDPIAQQAMYQEKIRQARLMQREMDRQKSLQYQAQMAQQQGM